MAYLFIPQPTSPGLPVFFNVDGVVGAAPAQNKSEDVYLVQFYFLILAANPGETRPDIVAAAKNVKVTGTIDQATVTAIRTTQQCIKATEAPGTVVDGRVSPAKGGYSYGSGVWTIVYLNSMIRKRYVDIWPRIDKIGGCPGAVKDMVTRTVAGK
jgi:hypothetical protein